MEATCGTPTPEGYRWTCGKHQPNDKLCHEALRIGSSAVFSDVGEKSSNKDLHNVA
jgi:hypothetical protein